MPYSFSDIAAISSSAVSAISAMRDAAACGGGGGAHVASAPGGGAPGGGGGVASACCEAGGGIANGGMCAPPMWWAARGHICGWPMPIGEPIGEPGAIIAPAMLGGRPIIPICCICCQSAPCICCHSPPCCHSPACIPCICIPCTPCICIPCIPCIMGGLLIGEAVTLCPSSVGDCEAALEERLLVVRGSLGSAYLVRGVAASHAQGRGLYSAGLQCVARSGART